LETSQIRGGIGTKNKHGEARLDARDSVKYREKLKEEEAGEKSRKQRIQKKYLEGKKKKKGNESINH